MDPEILNPLTSRTVFKRDRVFSSLATRLFFLVLLVADLFWMVYSFIMLAVAALLSLATFFKMEKFKQTTLRSYLSLKRSLVSGISLIVALFSPPFGIMIACTYFLMYDEKGIEEVVPSSLQDQFREFMKPPTSNE